VICLCNGAKAAWRFEPPILEPGSLGWIPISLGMLARGLLSNCAIHMGLDLDITRRKDDQTALSERDHVDRPEDAVADGPGVETIAGCLRPTGVAAWCLHPTDLISSIRDYSANSSKSNRRRTRVGWTGCLEPFRKSP
jgi:hypothetical protein